VVQISLVRAEVERRTATGRSTDFDMGSVISPTSAFLITSLSLVCPALLLVLISVLRLVLVLLSVALAIASDQDGRMRLDYLLEQHAPSTDAINELQAT